MWSLLALQQDTDFLWSHNLQLLGRSGNMISVSNVQAGRGGFQGRGGPGHVL